MKNKKLNIILVIILTLFILYFALKDNYQQIIPLLFKANIFWLIISYLLVLSYTFLKSVVTNEIINSFKKYSIIKTFKLQLMTFFFNAVTPFSTGGQPFQIYVLNKNKINLASSTNIIIQESIIHQIAVALVLLITLLLNEILNIYDLNFTMGILLIISFLINAIVVLILFILSFGKKVNNKIINIIINILSKLNIVKNKKEKLETSIKDFNEASQTLLKNKKRFIKLILINTLAIIALYITPLTISFSLSTYYAFNAIEAIVLVSFVSIICCYIPLPGGALGQEYLFTLFFGIYLSNPVLASLMLLWRFITYYLPMIVGAIIFNINQKKQI